jgi:hypothetical protein
MRLINAMFACLCLFIFAVPVSAQALSPAVPPVSAPPAALPAPTPLVEVDQWAALLERWNQVQKVPKTTAIRLDKKLAKPNAVTPWSMEVVGEDAEFLYLKNLPMEDPRSPMHKAWLQHEAEEASLWAIKETAETYFILDPFQEIVPPPFSDRLTFEERSRGLPDQGRWQMGFAVADMNRDGRVDIVAPPPRLGRSLPEIFFGAANGWEASSSVKWPAIRFDYGDVGVADFDGDGNLDIAIACHFLSNYVLYGDGKGDFTRYVELPRINPSVSSRALAVADFNGDRRPDIALLSELDMEMGTNETLGSGLLLVCLNQKSGWRAVDAAGGRANLFGDQVAVADFDADGDVDIVASSHKNINRFLVFTNGGDGTSWTANAPTEFPFRAYVRAVAAGNLDGVPGDEAVMGFHQGIQSGSLNFPRNAIAIYSFAPGAAAELVVRSRAIADIDATSSNDYTCATVGDLDGDGRPDLVLGRQTGAVRVFLQSVDGTMIEEIGRELSFGDAFINSLAIVDLAAGGPRALVVNASDGPSAKGGIRCFLPQRRALDSAGGRK